MRGIIDADTHIAESGAMWNMIDREMCHRRPVITARAMNAAQRN